MARRFIALCLEEDRVEGFSPVELISRDPPFAGCIKRETLFDCCADRQLVITVVVHYAANAIVVCKLTKFRKTFAVFQSGCELLK